MSGDDVDLSSSNSSEIILIMSEGSSDLDQDLQESKLDSSMIGGSESLSIIQESISNEIDLGSSSCSCTQGILIVDDTPFNIDVVEVMLNKFH